MPVYKAVSDYIKCAVSLLSAAMKFWAALRISTSLILSISIWASQSKTISKPDSALKEVFGPKIFVRQPLRMNNLIHFHSIVHELKIKDITPLLPLLTPAASTFALNSCDTVGPRGLSSVLWQHYH